MPIAPDTRLGPYVVVGPIGAGGMGEVYRARDARLGRDVAIKVLPANLASDRVALARFEREVRAVAALSHPNILAIFDTGVEAGVTYAVTELLEGETLRERLKKGPFSVRKATEYACQVAQGLAVTHEKGIVHRDLKPENLFLLPDGRVKILDFGLAREADIAPLVEGGETAVAVTAPGFSPGTPGYMAPEQVRGEPLSPQVDLFALGAVLFEMLCGKRAFQARTSIDTLDAILHHDPPDLTTVVPNVPAPLAQVVQRCLEKRPADRFQSARDLAFQLQMLGGTPTPSGGQVSLPAGDAATIVTGTASAVVQPAVPTRHRRLAWVGGLLLVAGAFAGGWLLRHPAPASVVRFHRATFSQQAVFRAAFAPDAGTFAYSAARNGHEPEVYLRQSGYPTSRPIGVPASHLLSISSTGELALLTRARIVGSDVLLGTLSRMPLGSTSPRDVVDDVRDAAWSPDGRELAIVHAAGGTDRLEFPPGKVIYSSTGYLGNVRVSPLGDRVAFVEHPFRWEARGSVVVVDRSGQRTVVAGEYAFVRGAVWRSDGAQIAFSARTDTSATTAIYGTDLKGTTRLLLQGAGNLTLHDIGPTGTWLVSRDDRRVGVRGRPSGALAEAELSWLDLSEFAALSSDGRTVLFTEFDAPGSPSGSVCLRAAAGSPVVSLAEGVGQDLSPDGKLTLILRGSPAQLIVDPTGAGEDRVLPRGVIEEYSAARWFPDGQRVLVCGAEKGKPSRCYVQDTSGNAPRAITADGDWGVVAPDGLRILVRRPDQPPVIYAIDGGKPTVIPSVTAEDVPAQWTPDGAGVFVYRPGRTSGQVDRIDLASGQRTTALQVMPADPAGLLAVEPITFTPDLASYAYGYTRLLSTIFFVEGVEWK